MTTQLSLFDDRDSELKPQRWATIRARQAAVRAEARQARDEHFRAWFRQRAREFGGVNERNRAQITAEANEYGKRAAEAVYIRHGYTRCTAQTPVFYPEENVYMPEDCDKLVSPGYTHCPDHSA